MIPLAPYVAFLFASMVLLLIPGPNVALIVSNSIGHGAKAGLVTVAGTSSAMVLQLALTVLGMTAVLSVSAAWFAWLRWAGVVYLLYLGIVAWRAAPSREARLAAARPKGAALFLRGFLVSLTNPKTLLFYGAFLPQFVSPLSPVLPQLLILSASFLALAVCLDGAWALLASRLRLLFGLDGRLRNRMQGGLLIGAGLGLALQRKT
jgi:threonine/homoserine/homoserine lactone efflux protein